MAQTRRFARPPGVERATEKKFILLALLGAALLGYLVSHVRAGVVFSDQALIALVGIATLAGIGLVDDLLKIRARQNRGLFWKLKGVITLLASFGIAGVLVAVI